MSQITKRNLRGELISRRKAMTLADHATKSEQISSHCVSLIAHSTIDTQLTVGLYWPIQNEANILSLPQMIAKTALGAKIQWALPTISSSSKTLVYAQWEVNEALCQGTFGITQPTNLRPTPVDIMLIPCVGFNEAFYRIGYGGGFFDRTLAAKRTQAIGIGFELSRCEWVAQPHDQVLDAMVTENSIRWR